MGRVLGRIITLAGAVAVNVIPGLGQLASSAILIGSAAVGYAVNSLLNRSSTKPDSSERSIKSPIQPGVKCYGTSRQFGVPVLFDTATNGTTVDVKAFAFGRARRLIEAYLNDDKVTLTGTAVQELDDHRYQSSHCHVAFSLGDAPGTGFSAVEALIPSFDAASHRGDGVVAGYLTKAPENERSFLTTYPQGDNVELSAVFEWQFLFDPRDPGQDPYDPDTWAFANDREDNAALCLMHYLMVERGYDYATAFAPVIDYWKDAADDCDTAFTLHAGGSEPKYRCWLSYTTNDKPANIIDDLLACFDGWLIEDPFGRLIVYSGKLYTPTVLMGVAEIVEYSLQSFVEEENAINEVTVSYISSEHAYQTVDAQPWRDETAIATSGRTNTSDLALPIPSHTQGRRLAKRKMDRLNAQYRGTLLTNRAGRAALGERYVTLTITEGGTTLFSGTIEIVSSPELDLKTGGVRFDWIAVDANRDAWNPATEDGEGAPVESRVALTPIDSPIITDATVELDSSGAAARARVTISAPDSADLTWYLRWKVSTDSIWNEGTYTDIDPGTSIELLSGLLPVNASIDIQVSYGTPDGRISVWSATETVDTTTDGLAPGPVTDVSASGSVGAATINWRNPISLNFDVARLYRATSNSFGSATQVGSDLPGATGGTNTYTDTIAAGTYYYWLTTVSATGVEGEPVATGAITVT